MNQSELFGPFEKFADVPGALEKLRELILEAAIRGRLVTRDPNDEPAGDLVARAQLARSSASPDRKNPHAPGRFNLIPDSSLPTGWTSVRLGQIAKIVRGVRFSSWAVVSARQPGTAACLRAVNIGAEVEWNDLLYINESHVRNEDHWMKPNDLVISISNSLAKVGKIACAEILPERTTFGGFLAVIRPFEIDATYLLFFLRAPSVQAALRATTSQSADIANIHLGALRALPIAVPPLAEQRRIVIRTRTLFALCAEAATRTTVACERRAAFVRRSCDFFGQDFNPTESRTRFKFIVEAFSQLSAAPDCALVLRQAILSFAVSGCLCPNELHDQPINEQAASGLFTVPKTWRWVTLGSVTKTAFGGLHRTNAAQAPDRAVGYIRPNNISSDYRCTLAQVTRIDATPGELAKYRLVHGDFLFNQVNSPELVGMTCVFQSDGADVSVFSESILKMQFADHVAPKYVNLWCASAIGQRELAKLKSGTTRVATITQRRLRTLLIPLPPLPEQHRIIARADKLLQLCGELELRFGAFAISRSHLLDSTIHRCSSLIG